MSARTDRLVRMGALVTITEVERAEARKQVSNGAADLASAVAAVQVAHTTNTAEAAEAAGERDE